MALTSVLLAAVLLVYWWRSYHGHVDTFTLGRGSPTESQFFTTPGRIALEVTDRVGATVTSRMQFYRFKDVLGYFLILPCLWVAVLVRSWLPRPPGKRKLAG